MILIYTYLRSGDSQSGTSISGYDLTLQWFSTRQSIGIPDYCWLEFDSRHDANLDVQACERHDDFLRWDACKCEELPRWWGRPKRWCISRIWTMVSHAIRISVVSESLMFLFYFNLLSWIIPAWTERNGDWIMPGPSTILQPCREVEAREWKHRTYRDRRATPRTGSPNTDCNITLHLAGNF